MDTPRGVVITGTTRGIGRALTDRLVELGHTVIGCGRSQGGVEKLMSAYGEPHQFAAVDVARWSEVEAWAASPSPETWAIGATDFLLSLTTGHNGESLSV